MEKDILINRLGILIYRLGLYDADLVDISSVKSALELSLLVDKEEIDKVFDEAFKEKYANDYADDYCDTKGLSTNGLYLYNYGF